MKDFPFGFYLLITKRWLWVVLVSSICLSPAGPSLAQWQVASQQTVLSISSLPATFTELDSLNGLGAYKLGTTLQSLPGMLANIKATRDGNVSCLAPAEIVLVDSLSLAGLVLATHHGRLASIHSAATTEQNAEVLLAMLQVRYGNGKCIGYQRYKWVGHNVTLIYDPIIIRHPSSGKGLSNPTTNLGSILVISNALAAAEKAEKISRRHEKKQ